MTERTFLICATALLAAATIWLIGTMLHQHILRRNWADSACSTGTFYIHGDEIELIFDNGEVWVGSFSPPGSEITIPAQEL